MYNSYTNFVKCSQCYKTIYTDVYMGGDKPHCSIWCRNNGLKKFWAYIENVLSDY